MTPGDQIALIFYFGVYGAAIAILFSMLRELKAEIKKMKDKDD